MFNFLNEDDFTLIMYCLDFSVLCHLCRHRIRSKEFIILSPYYVPLFIRDKKIWQMLHLCSQHFYWALQIWTWTCAKACSNKTLLDS